MKDRPCKQLPPPVLITCSTAVKGVIWETFCLCVWENLGCLSMEKRQPRTLFKYHFCLEWTIDAQSLHVKTLTPKLIGILFHFCPYRDQCYTRGLVMYTYSATFPHLALQWIPPSQASRSDRCSLTTSRNRVTILSLAPLWFPMMTRPCCLQMQAWIRYVQAWMQFWVTFQCKHKDWKHHFMWSLSAALQQVSFKSNSIFWLPKWLIEIEVPNYWMARKCFIWVHAWKRVSTNILSFSTKSSQETSGLSSAS